MPITIRELIASDTISQAVDKINFNFDQLLLNGGGPRGPVGPAGPIGPIGGRGIRGSVWYEGLGDPVNNPPTLTPEDEDNYLQANGDVWTYSEAGGTWINTGINLRGPVGPAGTSGKFSDYRVFPYDVAGDTTIYPNPMTLSGDGTNKSVKTVIVGGLPSNIAGNPASGNEVIDASLAQALVQPAVSLLVHQFDTNGGGIKFHGGDPLGSFSNSISQLSSIRLFADDVLTIQVPKSASSATVGFQVLTAQRNQFYQAGKEIKFQTGVTTASISGSNSFIVEADRNGTGGDPTIELKALAGGTAELIVGGTSASFGPAKNGIILADADQITMRGDTSITGQAQTITLNGTTSITGNAPAITLNGTTSTSIYAGGATLPAPAAGTVSIGASQSVSIRTADSSTGQILMRTGTNAFGDISITTGNASSSSIRLATGSFGQGSIEITTNTGNANGGQISVRSRREVEIEAFTIPGLPTTTGTVIIKGRRETSAFGSIRLETIGISAAPIVLTTAASSNTGINLITGNGSTGNVFVSTADGTGEIILQSAKTSANAITIETVGSATGNISIKTADGLTSTGSISLSTGTGSSGGIVLSTNTGTGNVLLLSAGSVLQTAGTTFTVTADQAVSITSSNQDITLTAGVPITQNRRVNIIAGTNALIAGTDDPRFAVDANNHYDHNTPFIVGLDTNIFSSGRYTPPVGNWAGGTTITWIRVGRVVTGTGRAVNWAGVSSALAVPIVGPVGVINISGTWVRERTNPADDTATGHITTVGGNAFDFLPLQLALSDFGLAVGYTIRFSFSYVIQ